MQLFDTVRKIIYNNNIFQMMIWRQQRIVSGQDKFVSRQIIKKFRWKIRLIIGRHGVIQQDKCIGFFYYFRKFIIIHKSMIMHIDAVFDMIFQFIFFFFRGFSRNVK